MKKKIIFLTLIVVFLIAFTLTACSLFETTDNKDNNYVIEEHECIDANSNHKCDECSKILSTCVDNDSNNKCDICNKVINPETGDGNEPGEETHDCVDSNNNHKCDICNDTLTTCIDSNNNHKCDICGETISNCKDDNKDHSCDICGEISQCTDSDNNHKCDICNDMLTTCIDSNNNHKCDICDSTLTSCKDETGDNLCDICGEEYYADGYVLVYELKGDGTYEVTGYKGTPVNVIIPSTYEDKAVTSIYGNAFYACTSLTSVTIGDSVTSIGMFAFRGCVKLVEVYNLSSLNITAGSEDNGYVGELALDVYTSLDTPSKLSTDSNGYIIYTNGEDKILVGYVGNETQLTLPDGITEIYDYAFYNCYSLTSVTIPDSVTSIGSSAFYGCVKLVEVYNLSSLNIEKGSYYNGYVGYYALDVYTSLDTPSKLSTDSNGYIIYTDGEDKILVGYVGNETELTLPSDITAINDYAFVFCTSLTSVTIGNSVTSIGSYAFFSCDSLTSVTIPDSVTSIGSYAFYDCDSLTSVTIPDSVKSIGSYAFYNCYSLTSVTIPDSVTSIGSYAFYNCDSLTSVTIGNSVKSIGSYAFDDCDSLTSVNINSIEAWCGITFDASDANPLSYGAKLYLNGTLVTDLVIPDMVTKINAYAFYDCYSLTSVTIPNSVTSIGYGAFGECYSLMSATIPNSVTSIGDYAFYACVKLVEVYNLSSLNITAGSEDNGYVGYYALDVYTSLDTPSKLSTDSNGYIIYTDGEDKILVGYVGNETELTLPDDITAINAYAFYDCYSLTSVTIPNSVTSIGYGAFGECYSLMSATIPNSVTSIGDYAFYACDSLTSVTIGNSVESIGSYAFSGCPIEKASIPTTAISYIPKGHLKEVVITSGDSIGNSAFSACTSLTSVTIGNSVTSIGDYAFPDCDSLTSVTIGNSVESIGYMAFYSCNSLTSIEFEDTTDWYRVYYETDWENKENGTLVDVSTPTDNDELFVDSYYDYYWYKE